VDFVRTQDSAAHFAAILSVNDGKRGFCPCPAMVIMLLLLDMKRQALPAV
jgi:hypothetical protein